MSSRARSSGRARSANPLSLSLCSVALGLKKRVPRALLWRRARSVLPRERTAPIACDVGESGTTSNKTSEASLRHRRTAASPSARHQRTPGAKLTTLQRKPQRTQSHCPILRGPMMNPGTKPEDSRRWVPFLRALCGCSRPRSDETEHPMARSLARRPIGWRSSSRTRRRRPASAPKPRSPRCFAPPSSSSSSSSRGRRSPHPRPAVSRAS